MVRGHGWHFLTRLKHNLQVNPDDTGNVAVEDIDVAVEDIEVPAHGRRVRLKGFGFVEVFRIVASNSDMEQDKIHYWATSDLRMEEIMRMDLAR